MFFAVIYSNIVVLNTRLSTAIKHQLTCPFEPISGSFLIGRRHIMVILRNHLVGLAAVY